MPTGDDHSARLRRLIIDEQVDEDADSLLAQARAQARERVLETLTDAFAEAMRERVLARLTATERAIARGSAVAPSAAPLPEPPGEASEPAWYVYGVIAAEAAGSAEDLPGIEADRPACALSECAVAAVVSRVRPEEFGEARLREHLSDLGWVEATARGHERTLELLCRRTTVIPMRMCSVYRTEGGVREMLRREQQAFADALARLEGKAEWGVKVFADSRLSQAAPSETSAAEEPRSGTAYLARKREERDAVERAGQLLEQAAGQVHARLCAAATDGRVLAPQRPEASGHSAEMILNGVYLVADADQTAFHAKVEELRDTFGPIGLELQETGPWPAYNFVPETIGAAW